MTLRRRSVKKSIYIGPTSLYGSATSYVYNAYYNHFETTTLSAAAAASARWLSIGDERESKRRVGKKWNRFP